MEEFGRVPRDLSENHRASRRKTSVRYTSRKKVKNNRQAQQLRPNKLKKSHRKAQLLSKRVNRRVGVGF